MARTVYLRTTITGGTSSSMDYIDGNVLLNGDACFVMESGIQYPYLLDDDIGGSESSPDLIAPDSNPGNKRWILQKSYSNIATDAQVLAMTVTTVPVAPGSLDLIHQFHYNRPNFTWVDTDTIIIGPGAYYLYGKGWCYWLSDITFNFGSGGSNAGSDNLTASAWQYIAIDYSSVTAAGVLTAANFINRLAASAPAYSGTKGGWYQDTNDRTIFAVLTDGSSYVLEFWHQWDLSHFAVAIESQAAVDIDMTFTDIGALARPLFSKEAEILALNYDNGGTGRIYYYRPNGSASAGKTIQINAGNNTWSGAVVTDANGITEWKKSASDLATITVYTMGWYFPVGM